VSSPGCGIIQLAGRVTGPSRLVPSNSLMLGCLLSHNILFLGIPKSSRESDELPNNQEINLLALLEEAFQIPD